ncbi:fibroblast growth factor receptor substrate 3 [Ctenodactylus gundi]
MGSCCSCLSRDGVPDNHPTKFKVTNVDDEGVELGSGVMELTPSELVLHLHRREAVHWPYLCLRRYGFDSNLFSFESGRRCQTGQGIFAFKCPRAEEIFSLLQDLMQCNSINVMEEPVMVTRSGHPAELDFPRTPQPPSALGYTVSGFSNGFPGCPREGPRPSAPRRPSASSLQHPTLAEEAPRSLGAPDEQSHTYVNTPARGEDDARQGQSGPQSSPEAWAPFPAARDAQVLLRPGQVRFVLGPAPASRHAAKRAAAPPHNNNQGAAECAAGPQCSHGDAAAPVATAPPPRRPAPLHYENLPPLWEARDAPTPTPTPAPDGDGDGDQTPLHRPLARRRGCPRVFSFDFRRPRPEPPRQLNYVQVELKGRAGRPPATARARAGAYAVIDLQKTAAMSSLQRARPRDDGSARKTRHNSADLPP